MRRKPPRLAGFDYSTPTAYFFTVCSHQKKPIFGHVSHGVARQNSFGKAVQQVWVELPNHFSAVRLDEFIVMPNHVHGLVWLSPESARAPDVGVELSSTPTDAKKLTELYEVVRALKSFSTRRINLMRNTPGAPVWQRNYYEHIIRNEDDLFNTRSYIRFNASKWLEDDYYTEEQAK